MRGWWNSAEACSVLGICATDRPRDDPVVTGSATPYLLVGAFAVGLILCEEWLQRRTGQSWWALDQLGWALISTLLAALLVYSGHLWGALAAAGLALFEIALVRRNWVKRGPRDLLERNQLELENPDAISRNSARDSAGLGVRGWSFVAGTVGLWSLLVHWGLYWVTAWVVATVIAIVLLRLTPRRPSDDSVRWNRDERQVAGDREDVLRSVGRDHDQLQAESRPAGEVHFTVSGRPARLIGRLLERLTRPTNTRNE